MAMHLGIKSQTFAPSENQEWLGSRLGTQEADSITLDAAACVALFPSGVVPSGIPLSKDAGTGRYVPATTGAADGHLFTTVDLTAGGAVAAASAPNTPAALQWIGEVVVSKVPAYAGRVDLTVAANQPKLIRYV